MKLLHLDLSAGISGDMFLGALVDLGCPLEYLNTELGKLGVLDLKIEISRSSRHGISATGVNVNFNSNVRVKCLVDAERIIDNSNLPDQVKSRSRSAFLKIAEAEAKVHDSTPQEVHFHELGSPDTLADIVGAFLAVEKLEIERFTSTAVVTGSGIVKIDHGVVPVPAPATAEILKGYAIDLSAVEGERTTPTGAAILTTLVPSDSCGKIASSSGELMSIGYGAGSKNFSDRANILRAMVLNCEPATESRDVISVLETTIDDMNPQIFGGLFEKLYDAGCLETFVTSTMMKKGRPGWNLTTLCRTDKTQTLASLLLAETTTAGVRVSQVDRIKSHRETIIVETEYGKVSVKRLTHNGTVKFHPEYDACEALAKKRSAPVRVIMESAQAAALKTTR